MAIAEWLSLNDHDEFMNVYAAVRGSIIKKSLDQVRKLGLIVEIENTESQNVRWHIFKVFK
jgi:hypothetical protein